MTGNEAAWHQAAPSVAAIMVIRIENGSSQILVILS
jgi:hypothetical protein